MKSDRQALEEAIELLDNPDHWTQGSYAVDRYDHPVSASSAEAQRWCAVGALMKMCEDDQQFGRTICSLSAPMERRQVTDFNDNHSHSDVILAMKRGLDLMDE